MRRRKPLPSMPPAGVCRICRCTEDRACLIDGVMPCSWADWTETLCTNPDCLAKARAEKAGAA
jgi:hypothetical protein